MAWRRVRQNCWLSARLTVPNTRALLELLENTYRYVNIALANEMAILCRELDVGLWEAIRCATTKPFGFQPFYPVTGSASATSCAAGLATLVTSRTSGGHRDPERRSRQFE